MAFLVDNIVPITLRIEDVIVFGGSDKVTTKWYNASGVIRCGVVINNCNEVIVCL